jgi:hypothetical protein
MGPINSLPLGFLDLLGLQAQGRNLSELAEQVAGTVDLVPHYAAYKRTFIVNAANFAAAVTSNILVATVPVGEYWFVIGGEQINGSAALGTGRAYIEIAQEGRGLFSTQPLSMAFADLNLATSINFGTSIPLIIAPGSTITKFGFGLAGAGNERLDVRFAYLPLRG